MDSNPSRNRVTVQQAAASLGVTEQAVRKRIKRGTLPHEREPDGRLYVYLDEVADAGRDEVPNSYADALISQMEQRIASLERQLEEANTRDRESRRLLAAALERMPEIEAAQSPERGETPAESAAKAAKEGEAEPERTEQSRSSEEPAVESSSRAPWWRRLFGRG